MALISLTTIESVCHRFGPGRLPKADSKTVGAGYAAATAAFVTTWIYAGIISLTWALSIHDLVSAFLFFSFGLPFVVPAAFIIGYGGWRYLATDRPLVGFVAGGIGAVLTYVLAAFGIGVILVLSSLVSLSGTDPVSAGTFTAGLLSVAIYLTWWVTIPLGCISGLVYVTVTNLSPTPSPHGGSN